MNRRKFLRSISAGAAVATIAPLAALAAPPVTAHVLDVDLAAVQRTNFAHLTPEQRRTWSASFWKQAREPSFMRRVVDRTEVDDRGAIIVLGTPG